jgi:hypothetical protein
MSRAILFTVIIVLGFCILGALLTKLWPQPTTVTYNRYKLVSEQRSHPVHYTVPRNGSVEVKMLTVPYTVKKPVSEQATVTVDSTQTWARAAVFCILTGLLLLVSLSIFGLWLRDKIGRSSGTEVEDNRRNFERVLTIVVSFAVTFFAAEGLPDTNTPTATATQLELQSLKEALSQMEHSQIDFPEASAGPGPFETNVPAPAPEAVPVP